MVRISLKEARKLGIITNKSKVCYEKRQKPKITKAQWDISIEPDYIKIIIPENMPSLNVWKKWHWTKQSSYKNYLTDSLAILAAQAGVKQIDRARIQVIHYYRVKRKRDEDNACPKFLLDALRYAGFISEDNSEVLRVEPPIFEIDRSRWRTEVLIYEWRSK